MNKKIIKDLLWKFHDFISHKFYSLTLPVGNYFPVDNHNKDFKYVWLVKNKQTILNEGIPAPWTWTSVNLFGWTPQPSTQSVDYPIDTTQKGVLVILKYEDFKVTCPQFNNKENVVKVLYSSFDDGISIIGWMHLVDFVQTIELLSPSKGF